MPKFASTEICTGCTACKNACPKQCIEMKSDINGFLYPIVNDISACIHCEECARICPVINVENQDGQPEVYAAFSKNESLRMKSSSGGLFSELAEQIIEHNGIVYGAAYDENFMVKHCSVSDIANLWKLQGAKYSESDLGDVFTDILLKLQNGRQVLFSGTPCQVAGLKAFLKKEYDSLYCVDFVCHGVPSPMAWESYIEYRSQKEANGEFPKTINLRSKSTGWSRYRYSSEFEYKEGKKCSIPSSASLFMKLFVGDYISRSSCENCKFKGYNRCSDITLGDFWGIWDIDSEMDDNKGTSVVLVRSEKGKKLWRDISLNVKHKEVTLEQASQQNPSMIMSSKANTNRETVLDKIRDGHIEECESLFKQPKISIWSRIKRKIILIIHKCRRAFLL